MISFTDDYGVTVFKFGNCITAAWRWNYPEGEWSPLSQTYVHPYLITGQITRAEAMHMSAGTPYKFIEESAIYLVKASRKPKFIQLVEDRFAVRKAEDLYNAYKVLYDAELSFTGVSVQVISEVNLAKADAVEMGGFDLPGIPVKYQCGGW